jgi:hypothetical protein
MNSIWSYVTLDVPGSKRVTYAGILPSVAAGVAGALAEGFGLGLSPIDPVSGGSPVDPAGSGLLDGAGAAGAAGGRRRQPATADIPSARTQPATIAVTGLDPLPACFTSIRSRPAVPSRSIRTGRVARPASA